MNTKFPTAQPYQARAVYPQKRAKMLEKAFTAPVQDCNSMSLDEFCAGIEESRINADNAGY